MKQGLFVAATLAVLFCLIISPLAFGQDDTANLIGKVIDTSGSPIPGVQILVVLNRSESKTKTNDRGTYDILDLPPGTYQVFVTVSRFKPKLTKVQLEKGATVRLNFTLDVMPRCPLPGEPDNGLDCWTVNGD